MTISDGWSVKSISSWFVSYPKYYSARVVWSVIVQFFFGCILADSFSLSLLVGSVCRIHYGGVLVVIADLSVSWGRVTPVDVDILWCLVRRTQGLIGKPSAGY